MTDPALIALPEICRFENPLLNSFPAPLFRRSVRDDTPVLMVRLGNRDTVIPLHDLQIRLGIAEHSPDGRMLNHISAALEFVHELRPGDPLPTEMSQDPASWQPDPIHLHIASHRLRGQFIQWLRYIGIPREDILKESDFDHAQHDPVLAERLNAAFSLVAERIQLPSAFDAIALLDGLIPGRLYVDTRPVARSD